MEKKSIVWHSQIENGDNACVTFTQRSRKRYTGYFIKELVNERALCDSHTKLSEVVHTWKHGMTFTQKKKNMVQKVYNIWHSPK